MGKGEMDWIRLGVLVESSTWPFLVYTHSQTHEERIKADNGVYPTTLHKLAGHHYKVMGDSFNKIPSNTKARE